MMKAICLLALVATASAQPPPRMSSKAGSVVYKIDPSGDVQFDFGGDAPMTVKGIGADITGLQEEIKELKKDIATKFDALEEDLAGNISDIESLIEDTVEQIQNETNTSITNVIDMVDGAYEQISDAKTSMVAMKRDMNTMNDTLEEHTSMFGMVQSMIQVLTDYDHAEHSENYVDFHKDICNERSRGYNVTGENCVDCTQFPQTSYNAESRACSSKKLFYHGLTQRVGEETLNFGSCTSYTSVEDILPSTATTVEDGEYELYLKFTVQTSFKTNCYSSQGYGYMWSYLMIDNAQQGNCDYRRINRYDSRESTFIYDVLCSTRVILKPGEHKFALRLTGYGKHEISGAQNSVASYLRYIQPASAATVAESTTACKATLASNLMTSYMQYSGSMGCQYCKNFGGWTDISSRFQQRGPWTVRSQSGYIHVFIKIRYYMRSYYPNAYGKIGSGQLRISVNGGNSNAVCSLVKHTRLNTRFIFDQEYYDGSLICSTVVRATTARIQVYGRFYGYYHYTYGSTSSPYSIMRVEEVPAPQLSVPSSIATGCKNKMQRRIIALNTLSATWSKFRVNTLTTYDLDRMAEVKFTTQELTSIRAHFKVDVQLTSSTSYYSNKVEAQLIPVVNGKSMKPCGHFSRVSPGTTIDGVDSMNCNIVFSVEKGTHSLKFKVAMAGNSVAFLATDQSNLLLVEALDDKQSYSTKV